MTLRKPGLLSSTATMTALCPASSWQADGTGSMDAGGFFGTERFAELAKAWKIVSTISGNYMRADGAGIENRQANSANSPKNHHTYHHWRKSSSIPFRLERLMVTSDNQSRTKNVKW
ncbi:hypothetical protein [Janthinobacterium sp. GW458P]|uniref:hypothetical protein n=1 Tax=Janthinobacterium sp. GW458P TaxID=1981504 RepID=UPI00111E4600|nr:hypothetical protein [Janthinobacterium sp. GW458P]MBE3025732.1 hypothetical protein [Janthinobacterium sp. GW458P]